MSRDIRESDWKIFRELRLVALDRLCERALKEVEQVAADESNTFHERYLKIWKVLERRDREVANAFNDFRRSTAVVQLGIIISYNLLTDAELLRFSEEVQRYIQFFRAGRA